MTKLEVMEEVDDEAIFFPDLDGAIIGYAERCGMPRVVCYDYQKTIDILKNSFSITEADLTEEDIEEGITLDDKKYEMALEWYDFNTIGGYLGEYTPLMITVNRD